MGRVLILLLAAFAIPANTFDEPQVRALAFEKHWDPYVRRLFGCAAAGDTNLTSCRIRQGSIDYREYASARDAAKLLFDLKDK